MGTGRYLNRTVRLLIAFAGALFSVLFGRLDELSAALARPLFYLALIISFGIALLMIALTHHAWEWFENARSVKFYTILKLALIGYFTPIIIDFLCMALYYALMRQNILTNGVLTSDLFVVSILILTLNVIYFLFYLGGRKRNHTDHPGRPEAFDKKLEQEPDFFIVNHKSTHVKLKQVDIILCYRSLRKSEIITHSKGSYTSNQPITHIAGQLNSSLFRQINRGVIVNLNTIKGYVKGSKRDLLQLIIRKDFQPFFEVFSEEQLSVTKEYKEGFKQAFDALQEEI